MLANLDNYFTADELSAYIDEFIAEGRLSDDGLYVFPLAKSTEILYLNQTLFDAFAGDTGASKDQLSTFEGIAQLAKQYYEWTDAKTPDTPNDGKQFFSSDACVITSYSIHYTKLYESRVRRPISMPG